MNNNHDDEADITAFYHDSGHHDEDPGYHDHHRNGAANHYHEDGHPHHDHNRTYSEHYVTPGYGEGWNR